MNQQKTRLIKLGLVIFAFGLILFVSSPSVYMQEKNPLVGRWQSSESTLEFRSDGTMSLNGKQYPYKIENSAIVVTNNGKSVSFPFELNGDYLTVTLPNQRVMYKRVTGGNSGRNSNDEQNPGGNQRQGGGSSGIVGRWKSDDGTALEIRANGTITIDGTPYSYKSNGSSLAVSNDKGGTANFPYQFNGDELIVTIQGRSVPFKRIGGEAESLNETKPRQQGGSSSGIIGRWQSDKGVLEFRSDGTMIINGEQVNYKVNGAAITVSSPQGSLNFPFQLSGDQLIMGAQGRQVVYTRIGGVSNSDGNDRGGESFDNKPSKGGIVGRWQSDKGIIEIRSDGTIIINGAQYNYKINGSVITVSSNQGSENFPFQLSGDTMIVGAQGGRVTYTRMTGSNTGNTGGQRSGGGGRQGGVAPELVGKWCYYKSLNLGTHAGSSSDSCITLNADGTYEYYRENGYIIQGPGSVGNPADHDTGRWSVSGNTITALSNKKGTLILNFEKQNHPKTGDPMIVIEGDAYVTYYKKAPW